MTRLKVMDSRFLIAKRCVRRTPKIWLREWLSPIFDRSQLLTFSASVIALMLFLRHATPQDRDSQASNWALMVESFGIALLAWAIINFFRAPIIAISEDKSEGTWHGTRFVYHLPQLIAVERCAATGHLDRFKIRFAHAEPGAFVFYRIEVENDYILPRIFVAVFSEVWLSPKIGASHLTGGLSLPRDRSAWLAVKMLPRTVSQTIRVYMVEFTIGDLMDHDGEENRPHTVRGLAK
jgi:hypothetical protein